MLNKPIGLCSGFNLRSSMSIFIVIEKEGKCLQMCFLGQPYLVRSILASLWK